MWIQVGLTLLLSVCSLLSIKMAYFWVQWCRDWSPSAAALPLPFLLVVAGWICLSRVVKQTGCISTTAKQTVRAFWQAWSVSLVLYALMTLRGADSSLGRWLTVGIWTGCVTAACLTGTLTLQQLRIRQLVSRSWKLRLLAGGLGLGLCAGAITVSELVCGRLLAARPVGEAKRYEGTYLESGALFRHDADLGTAMHPDRRVSCRLFVGDRQVWDVHYSTDQYGRRRTVFPGTSVPEASAVFLGCSFLFGEGSEDPQTIPSVFCELAPEFVAVNYGVPGWGTQQMLSLLEAGRVRRETALPVKLGVYLYLPEVHEARVIGDMDFVNDSSIDFPCYVLDPAGGVRRNGSFRTARPLTNLFYDVARASRTRALLGLNFPRRTPAHYMLTAAIIAKSRDIFLQEFPESRFLLVAYPGGGAENLTITECRRCGVEVLNLQGRFDAADASMQHYGDGHPTAAANRITASSIVSFIQNSTHAK